QAMGAGDFRSDLYYRIADHSVRLPALREHADRAALVQGLWQRLGQGRQLENAALEALAGYPWPGNVRQLCSCLRTLVALSDPGELIRHAMLPAYLQATPAPVMPSTAEGLDAMTETAMREALRASH
ncbi:sigma-54-dependent Fis family transcriptional regulator, partial [Mycobacterium tuberculosis]